VVNTARAPKLQQAANTIARFIILPSQVVTAEAYQLPGGADDSPQLTLA
jgi:hypothetical protein